jgi:hypothetical protein
LDARLTTAGYSGTPLAKKLGIREGARLTLVRAPEGFESLLSPIPDGVRIGRRIGRGADVIVAFHTSRAQLEAGFDRLRVGMHDAGGLWIAWPKRASGVATDVTEDVVREIALAKGLVDNKVCAIDATWSGLRIVVRVADRGAVSADTGR